MAHKEFSRIGETSASTGTGDLTLDGAIAGFLAVGDRYSDGDTFDAVIAMGADWETVTLTYHVSTNSVTRTEVQDSSNGGAAVNWGAGDKTIKGTKVGLSDLTTAGLQRQTNLLAQATATSKGVAELATQAEADAATDTDRIVAPYVLHRKVGAAGELWGMTLSNNVSDATNDIDIAAGFAADRNNLSRIILPSALTKRLDANWAAGTNQGMRYSGASIANTSYGIFAGSKAGSADPDVYAYPGMSEPTALAAWQAETGGASYVNIRRVGAIIRAGGTILAFTQVGDEFRLVAEVVDRSSTALSSSWAQLTLSVPIGLKLIALLGGFSSQNAAGIIGTEMADGDQPSTPTSIHYVAASTFASDYATFPSVPLLTDTSGRIRFRVYAISGSPTLTSHSIRTRGWIDRRGRLAA